jgi:hypothetical protein
LNTKNSLFIFLTLHLLLLAVEVVMTVIHVPQSLYDLGKQGLTYEER